MRKIIALDSQTGDAILIITATERKISSEDLIEEAGLNLDNVVWQEWNGELKTITL